MILFLLAAITANAETGHEAWLRYAAIAEPSQYASIPAVVVSSSNSQVIASAEQELIRGIRGMLGRILRAQGSQPNEPAIILETAAIKPDSYRITRRSGNIV